jgi:capsular polysaccharide biosynthesis protein
MNVLSAMLSRLIKLLLGLRIGANRPTSASEAETEAPIALSTVAEDVALLPVVDAMSHPVHQATGEGCYSLAVEAVHLAETDLIAAFAGKVGGRNVPVWADGHWGGLRGGVILARATGVDVAPAFGSVTSARGVLYQSTVAEAKFYTPSLGALPNVEVRGDGPVYHRPIHPPRMRAATVFLTWGGVFNYGHFLLDCLPTLALVADRKLLRAYPAVTPHLNQWQRNLVQLLIGPELVGRDGVIREVGSPIVRVDDCLFTNCMDHFLHNPNAPLDRVRQRILERAPPPQGPRRVYLSRRGDKKREMVNEAELEAALAERGFTIVQPERFTPADQIALLRGAEVVVAPAGAGLANCLFLQPGCKVFEITPSNFTGVWVRGLCHYVGADWHGFFCPSPLSEDDVYVEGVLKPGVQFRWRTPTRAFMDFLDERL